MREATSVIETDRWADEYRRHVYLLDGYRRVPLEDDDKVEKFVWYRL